MKKSLVGLVAAAALFAATSPAYAAEFKTPAEARASLTAKPAVISAERKLVREYQALVAEHTLATTEQGNAKTAVDTAKDALKDGQPLPKAVADAKQDIVDLNDKAKAAIEVENGKIAAAKAAIQNILLLNKDASTADADIDAQEQIIASAENAIKAISDQLADDLKVAEETLTKAEKALAVAKEDLVKAEETLAAWDGAVKLIEDDLYNKSVELYVAGNSKEDLLKFAEAVRAKLAEQSEVTSVPVYRLYNSGLKVHLYTTDANEYAVLAGRGWSQEGVAFKTSTDKSGKAVYRLYNSGLKVHLYTTDANEYAVLAERGWNQEGVAFYSKGEVAVYRLYNAGLMKHVYTTDANEYKVLAERGWSQEGVAFYSEK